MSSISVTTNCSIINVAENIMSRDLKISAEIYIETLRGWVEEIKENPNPLKYLIREHL
ncbi:hypothetical protein RYX36_022999 [Vicia faba]